MTKDEWYMTNDEWYEQLKRRHDSKDWSEIERKVTALDIAYAESDEMYRESNTGRVRFEHEMFPSDPAAWSTQYPDIFHLLTLLVDEGALQEEGGYYVIESDPTGAERSAEVEFAAGPTGLVAHADLKCRWPEPFESASQLTATSGLWDGNENEFPPEGTIEKLAEALIEHVPGSSQQLLNAPSIYNELNFGDESTLEVVLRDLNALEHELCEQNYRAWSDLKSFAKDFLSRFK